MRRHRAPHGVAPTKPPRQGVLGPHKQQVAYLQVQARGRLVMWPPWRRAFTAIAQFGPVPLILDDPNPHELLKRCRAVELSAAQRWPARA